LGGSGGLTNVYHFDVRNDYLAMVGDTYDSTITGISGYVPYVAMHSVSNGGKIYWTKVFSYKPNEEIRGVKFSTDGALLITHSYYC
jgi:hypothetical protein